MAQYGKWYFTNEQLVNSPSRRSGINLESEIYFKQDAAQYIQIIGERIEVSQTCINTAIVYMRRFFVYHSLKEFHRHALSVAILFLTAKINEEFRPMEMIIRKAFSHLLRGIKQSSLITSNMYIKLQEELIMHEHISIQTLGFDLNIVHPHVHIVQCCEMIKVTPDILKWSEIIANNSLYLTSMCLQYPPKIVACFSIYFVCKWSNTEIPLSTEGKYWFQYIDETITDDLLQQMVTEYLNVYDKCQGSSMKKRLESVQSKISPETSDSGYSSPKDIVISPKKKLALARVYRLDKMKINARNQKLKENP